MDQPSTTTPQAPPAPQQTPDQYPVGEKTTDTLGIISIICAFVGFQLIGFILGLVGASKAKKEGRSPTLSKVGWIINLIMMLLVIPIIVIMFITFNAAQDKAQQSLENVQREAESSMSATDDQMPSKLEFAKGERAQFGTFEVTVNTITRNYVPESKFSQAEAGKELIVVEVSAKNLSDTSEYISKFDFDIDLDGMLEGSSYVKSPGTEFPSGSLAPNASTTGQIVFEVPAGKTDLSLAYKDYVTDSKTYESKEVIYKLAL